MLLETVQRRDVRMIERREHPRLAFEAFQSLPVFRYFDGQELESDLPPEDAVARAVHLAHSADADERENLVVADGPAYPR
jgi:hypothetical protein